VTTLPSNSAIIAENSITAYKNDDFFGRHHLQMGAVHIQPRHDLYACGSTAPNGRTECGIPRGRQWEAA
jgi:hypothetical protein